ncbi:DNA polymerase III subunit epsilon [Lactobacillus rossiae]|uniref:DNA polymerase III polC-type n=2 Tax=Furfurilactobacillus milii TaxID=2888272 RepID=A0A6N9I3D1_9LACO|nr:DNA polymerase III subunit epsilon [Furfurilactobacillus milii]
MQVKNMKDFWKLISILILIWLVITFWWVLLLIAVATLLVWGIIRYRQKRKRVIHMSSDRKDITSTTTSQEFDEQIKSAKPIKQEKSVVESIKQATSEPNFNYNAPIHIDRPVIHQLRRKLTDFVVVDIETTGFDEYEDGITQISAVKYKNDIVTDTFDTYVKPGCDIPQKVQFLTHITNEKVANAPTAKDAIEELKSFVGNIPLVGHNFRFDLKFLIHNGFNLSDISYEDTLPMSNSKLPELDNHKLPTLKHYFGITNESHNSLNDCKTTGTVYQHLRDDDLDSVPISEPTTTKFAGLRFCITGQFMEASRDEISELIIRNGGRVTKSVSKLTNYLIDGIQVDVRLTDGVHSGSELKAAELIQNGSALKIIDYQALQELLANSTTTSA